MVDRKRKAVHLFGELFSCPQERKQLLHAQTLREDCLRLVRQSGLTIVGDCFYQFPAAGVTGTVILAESHLAIHTWPEAGFVTLDVFVCNHTEDNRSKAHWLFEALCELCGAGRVNMHEVHRDQPS